MKPRLLLGIGLAFVAGMATAIMTGNALVRARQDAQAEAARQQLQKAAQQDQAWLDKDEFLSKLNEANRRIASAVEPSVVHLRVSKVVTVTDNRGRQRRRTEQGAGSGWVFDQAGHIVTNAHVVSDEGDEAPRPDAPEAERPRIHRQLLQWRLIPRPHRGRGPAHRHRGDLRGQGRTARPRAPRTPQRHRLPGRPRSTPSAPPFGFKFSMSQGIISGLSRDPSDRDSNSYTNYLQTDAAVNPGNSGGPLCDIRGRVVGMNVAMAADTLPHAMVAASRGVGFAIPLSTIEPIVEQLVTVGQVSKGFLGVNMAETDETNDAGVKGAGTRARAC